MKPAPFIYHRPASIAEALETLLRHGDDAKLLAGGQSLVPLMNMRLARPALLVDVTRIPALSGLAVDPAGELTIAAATPWVTVENSSEVRAGWPLLVEAIHEVGHFQIRNRGTLGGSAAHADPAAELPAVMLALGGSLVIESTAGRRRVAAEDFFVGVFSTALAADEILVELRFPPLPPGARYGFAEFARRHGDFAQAGAAYAAGPGGHRLAVFGVGGHAQRLESAERTLLASGHGPALAAAIAADLAGMDISDDIHGTAEWRRSVVAEMARRALQQAAA